MSASVTCVKYWYQEHHTVGARRSGPTPTARAYASPQAASAEPTLSWVSAVTGASAETVTRPSAYDARIEATSAWPSVVAYSLAGPPSPGSTPSSPSPWNPRDGPGLPGRYDMTWPRGRAGRHDVASTGYDVVGLQLCQPCSWTRARTGSTAISSTVS